MTAFDDAVAQEGIRDLIIEVLRGLADGEDKRGANLSAHISGLADGSSRGYFDLRALATAAISDAHRDAFASLYGSEGPSIYMTEILRSAVAVLAEALSNDGFARGRWSQRNSHLIIAINEYVEWRESKRGKT